MIDARSRFHRTTLTTDFVAESCCLADMNGDGIDELVAGGQWWPLADAPDPAGPPTTFRTVDKTWLPAWGGGPDRPDPHAHLRESSGLTPQYRAATYDWPIRHRPNGPDGLLSVGMHQDPIRWFTHQPNRSWAAHPVTSGGIYESAVYAELDALGTRGLVTVPQRPYIAWYEPSAEAGAPWVEHLVGERGGNWHGLGVGVLDNDHQPHILTPTGIYSHDDDIRRPWRRTNLGHVDETGCHSDSLGDVCLIHTHRLPGAESASLFAASPHGRGLWRWELVDADPATRTYRRYFLDDATSQTHALLVMAATEDEPVDAWVITGKRWHAHGPDHDLDPAGIPVLVRVGVFADPDRAPLVEIIDDRSGVGMNFTARRLADGRMQIATANKLGVHLFTETKESLRGQHPASRHRATR